MINPVPQNIGVYPGANPSIYPVMYENHTNPEAEQFRSKLYQEIKLNQAEVKVQFLQNTLNASDTHQPNKEMTKVQRNVAEAELQNAQRELALLKQQFSPDKLKMMGY